MTFKPATVQALILSLGSAAAFTGQISSGKLLSEGVDTEKRFSVTLGLALSVGDEFFPSLGSL